MKTNHTVSDTYYHFTGWNNSNFQLSIMKMVQIIIQKQFVFSRNQRQWHINNGYSKLTRKQLALSHFYIKMICFTETPIPFLKDTVNSRGGVCIGMKRDWLLKNNGQSVVYVSQHHPNDYGRAVTELLSKLKSPQVTDLDSQEEAKIISNLTYSLIAATEDVGYVHEREWRIIKNELNEFMDTESIEFEISDIESIWCEDSVIPQLTNGLISHPDYGSIIALIKPLSNLDNNICP